MTSIRNIIVCKMKTIPIYKIKNNWNVFFAFVLVFILSTNLNAQQFQLNTVPPLNGGSGTDGVTFNVTANQNIRIDTIFVSLRTNTNVDVWYNLKPINGAPTIDSANGWVQLVNNVSITNVSGTISGIGIFTILK